MAKFDVRRWLKSLVPSTPRPGPSRRKSRLLMEELERRETPATWDGGGATPLWTNPQNWVGDQVPNTTGTEGLVFPANALQFTNTNNFPNAIFTGITFADDEAYVLNGNKITLLGNTTGIGILSNQEAGVTSVVNFDIELGAGIGNRQFFTVGTSAPGWPINGQLSGTAGVELAKDGDGHRDPAGDNIGFTGNISIPQGDLRVTHANALGDTTGITTVAPAANSSSTNVSGKVAEQLRSAARAPATRAAISQRRRHQHVHRPIDLDSNSTFGAIAGTLVVQGQIGDFGAGHDLTKVGPGTVVLDPRGTSNLRATPIAARPRQRRHPGHPPPARPGHRRQRLRSRRPAQTGTIVNAAVAQRHAAARLHQ